MAHPIFPYGPPTALADNLWQIQGSLKVPVPRNMTIVRSPRGELVIYSAIAMHEEGMRALEALGRPTWLIIPHRRHQLDAQFYKTRYPELRVLAPAPERVHSVTVDGGLRELTAVGIDAYVLPGNAQEDVVMDVALADGRALCVCESLGNIALSGWLGLLFRVLGPPGGGFGIARAVRLRELPETAKTQAWLRNQAARTDLRALLFGHGAPLTRDVPAALERAANQL